MAKNRSGGGWLESIKTILYAGLIAVGAVGGAQLGARYGRRLSPAALRGVIVAVGLVAIVRLVA